MTVMICDSCFIKRRGKDASIKPHNEYGVIQYCESECTDCGKREACVKRTDLNKMFTRAEILQNQQDVYLAAMAGKQIQFRCTDFEDKVWRDLNGPMLFGDGRCEMRIKPTQRRVTIHVAVWNSDEVVDDSLFEIEVSLNRDYLMNRYRNKKGFQIDSLTFEGD